MRCTLNNGQQYTICFHHHRHVTTCVIVRLGGGESAKIGIGHAFCNPSDRYSQDTGRSLALARAMGLADFRTDVQAELGLLVGPRQPRKDRRRIVPRAVCPECRKAIPAEAIHLHRLKFHISLRAEIQDVPEDQSSETPLAGFGTSSACIS